MPIKGKILFIIHDVYQDDNEFPLGPAYLAAILTGSGYEVQIYCQDVFHYSNDELADFLDNNEFDIIGLGFLAARYAETIRPLAKVINAHKKKAKFVLGGYGVTATPEYVLGDTKADVAVLGEAEATIIPIVEKIITGADLGGQAAVAFWRGDKIIVNPRVKPVVTLDSIPLPQWDLFPVEKYINSTKLPGSGPEDKTIAVLTSRGCINRCSFCYRIETGIRIRSISNVFEELNILNSKYGVTYFEFIDEMFIPSRQRIIEFVSVIKKLPMSVKYYCQARVELAKDKEALKLLADSGCQILNLGLESLDQNVLDLMGKRTKVEDNYEAVENIIAAGMHPGLNFIWANPGDSIESLSKIVDFLLKYDTLGQLRTIRPPTPFPGCPLYYEAIQEGKLNGPGDFFDKFTNSDRLTVNYTNLSDDEVYAALLDANSRLIKNYFRKKNRLEAEAVAMIDNFRRLYFLTRPEDAKFRGARHYHKVDEAA